MGGKVDNSINRRRRGPYVFRLHGQTYNSMGSLIPKEGTPLKFAQLYIYDTENNVETRAKSLRYHLKIPHRKKPGQPTTGKKDKMQFLVDGYTMVETERLYFHREKESKLRCDKYSNIRQNVTEGITDPALLGKPVVLSSSFTGGPSEDDATQVCIADEKCTKHFPKKFTQRSSVDLEGYPVIEDVITEDMWRSVKDNCITVMSSLNKLKKVVDEIKAFYDCMYLSACEAPWRIFGFETHYRTPSVRRLSFHLPGEQTVLYDENSDLETVMHKPSVSQSMLEGWMKMNEPFSKARELTYAEFPKKYVWNAPKRIWTLRKQGRSIG
nr:hypothetical protein [Tanacetum cinerariifolium]